MNRNEFICVCVLAIVAVVVAFWAGHQMGFEGGIVGGYNKGFGDGYAEGARIGLRNTKEVCQKLTDCERILGGEYVNWSTGWNEAVEVTAGYAVYRFEDFIEQPELNFSEDNKTEYMTDYAVYMDELRTHLLAEGKERLEVALGELGRTEECINRSH